MAKTAEAATVDAVMAWIHRTGSAKVRDGLARYGLPATNAVGIPVGAMRAEARRIGPNHALALELWKTGNYEAQLMAAMLGEPERLTAAQMDAWCRDFDNWGTVDTACFTLFDRSPLGWKMAPKWSKERGEFQKRAGFVMMACLAAHDKTAKDSAFLKFFPIIEKGAADDRNFVKKGVSWALRHLGHRSAGLHAAAVKTATRLSKSDDATERWVGKDALRDLLRPAVLKKVQSKRSKCQGLEWAAMKRTILLLAVAGAAAGLSTEAQQLRPPATADFAQWEALAFQPRAAQGPLSPDGKWLAYGINRSNRNNELRIANVASGETAVAAFGDQPAFSADSKWIAYGVAISEAEEAKLRKAKKPLHRKMGLRNLSTGEVATFDSTESFAFNHNGSRIAMKRYAAESKDEPDKGNEELDTPKPGATLVVRDLTDGRDTTFGNVAEFAWQSSGGLLAMTISAEGRTGNGVQIFDPATGALRALDSATASYSGIAWRKDSGDLAVLRSKSDATHDGPTQVVLAWTGLGDGAGKSFTFDPTAANGLAANRRILAARQPSWSEDGARVFVGVADWSGKPGPKDEDADETASVDVWHWKDTVVVPRQKSLLPATRTATVLASWSLADGRLTTLATDPLEDVRPIRRRPATALIVDRKAYAMERSIGRPFVDVSTVDIVTGTRTKIKDRIEDQYVQSSPGGRYLLYLLDDHYWTVDLKTGTQTNITKAIAASFVDKQSDDTVKQKPAFGVAGWTHDDAAVWIYDKFDIWSISPDGTASKRLTDGALEQVRHQYIRLDPDADFVDPRGFVSVFGVWSKKSGFARLDADGAAPRAARTVWLDKSVTGLSKARHADIYAYSAQAFDDSPDYFVGDAGLTGARQVSHTNPFQANFAWGRSELVEYKNDRGERLQGVLSYPADYQPGRKYPMVVFMYERLSDGLHSYVAPSERSPYNASVFTSRGYFFLQPDIVFRPREPGLSVVECVLPAVKAVVAKGQVDPAKVGVVGHSWGGFDASFLATHTDVFAAAVAGAPITNLVSNYGNFHWSNGIAETDHIETGQQRMEVPIYEDLQAYIRNSAVYGVGTMKTPLLISVGDQDGNVFWHQGLELYNIARRAGKNVVLVAYAGEDHGLRKKPNQVDYHHRIQQWFDHYLKGEPAAAWIKDGQSVLDRERELKKGKPAPPQKTTAPE